MYHFEKKTGVPFFRISWSANEELFKDYQEEYKNDTLKKTLLELEIKPKHYQREKTFHQD